MRVTKEPGQIRSMFSAIAPRYDLLNHLLSFSIDKYWRWRAVRAVNGHAGGDRRILDLCTGTADLALRLARFHSVVGCDFSHAMLRLAVQKTAAQRVEHRLSLVEADALALPFRESSFDAVTVAFGLRNLENYESGLREMKRVLKPAGALAVLEFSEPRFPILRQAYLFYFSRILPKVGEWISRRRGAYSYLCHSVRDFPPQRELEEIIAKAGLRYVRHYSLTGGIATLHIASKQTEPDA